MPLATAGTVLRLTAEEKDLFAIIRTQRFRVTLVEENNSFTPHSGIMRPKVRSGTSI